MYIDELKMLSNVEGFEPEANIFDQEGNISSDGIEKIKSTEEPTNEGASSYNRFLLKLKVCLIELGKLTNLQENKQSDELLKYLRTLNKILQDVNSDEQQQVDIKRCDGNKNQQQCQDELLDSINKLDEFRGKVEDVLKNKKDDIEGFKNAAKAFVDLKTEIDKQIIEINNKGDNITDDEIEEFKKKIEAMNEGDADDIPNVIDKLDELKINLTEKRKKAEEKKEIEKDLENTQAKHAALTAEMLKANTEPVVGAEESKSGNIEEVEDTLVEPTDGRESRMSIDGDVEFNEQIKKSNRNIEQIQKESQELDARIKESEDDAEKEVQKTLAGLETITSGPGKSRIPEGPPITTDDDDKPPKLPPPLDDESVTVGNQDDIQGPSETVGKYGVTLKESPETVGNQDDIKEFPETVGNQDDIKESPETVESVKAKGDNPPAIPTSQEVNLTENEKAAAKEEGEEAISQIGPSTGSKTTKKRREELLPADTSVEGYGQKVSETVPPLDEGDDRPVIELTDAQKKERKAEEQGGGRKRKQPKKKKRKSKKKSRRKSNKKSKRKSKKKRN